MMKSIEESYTLFKMIGMECVKEGLVDNVDLCCQCVVEGQKLYEMTDLSLDSIVSQIKEKYMMCNN